jgi:hypothetical protein
VIIFEYPEQGMSEERKQAHRIERLLQEEIKLLQQILAALPKPPQYLPTAVITVTPVAPLNPR